MAVSLHTAAVAAVVSRSLSGDGPQSAVEARQGPSAGRAGKGGPVQRDGAVRGDAGGRRGARPASASGVPCVPGWTRRGERVSRQRGSNARSAGREAGDATSGETTMKSSLALHLEDAAFALVAATMLVGVPVAVVLLGLR